MGYRLDRPIGWGPAHVSCQAKHLILASYGNIMKLLRALFAFSIIPLMAACSSNGQLANGWNGCVVGGALAGATAGVALDGHLPGGIVGAAVGGFAGAMLCGGPDSDGDGVADSQDRCPGTPKGVAVDARGCPIDSDGDGVSDYLDKCPNTEKGVPVDATGCPADSDGDGVPDATDRCPGTPAGAQVDASGCPLDSDGDGVADYLDKCPDTAANTKVDEKGCTVNLLVLHGIKFAFDSTKVSEASSAILDRAVKAMADNPTVNVRIVGHTDSVGSDEYNDGLSKRRAAAVRSFLVNNGVSLGRMDIAGEGESQPIASNETAQGRKLNRRVEFQVLKN